MWSLKEVINGGFVCQFDLGLKGVYILFRKMT